jgi:RNA polymerase sigma-70 factor (ECF subfamily)
LATDEHLLREARKGNETAFAELFRRHQSSLLRYALHMAGDRAMAEDAVQEAFLSLLRATLQFDEQRGSLRAYLFGIVRWQTWRRVEDREEFDDLPLSVAAETDLMDGIGKQERVEQVRAAIALLPPVYREVVVLCELEELSYEEAAKALECPPGTIRSRLSRGKQLLAAKLKAKFVGGRP